MGTRDENGSLKAVQLTVDLKPNLPRTVQSLYFLLIRVFLSPICSALMSPPFDTQVKIFKC